MFQKNLQYFDLIQPFSAKNHSDKQLQLIVNHELDHEIISQHNLTIEACDGGKPFNCGHLNIVIHIGDINDNSPIFQNESYKFSIAENSPKGTFVGRIEAYDFDSGQNQKIKYKFMSSNGDYVNTNFNLDELSGVITLARSLDFEIDKQFTLKAEARDFGIGSLPAYAHIDIEVLDLNDNIPRISVSFLNSLYRNLSEINTMNNIFVYLLENTEANQFIAHAIISDPDSPKHSFISWKVLVNNVDISILPYLNINELNDNSFIILTG